MENSSNLPFDADKVIANLAKELIKEKMKNKTPTAPPNIVSVQKKEYELIQTLHHVVLNIKASKEANNTSRTNVFIDRANEISERLLDTSED